MVSLMLEFGDYFNLENPIESPKSSRKRIIRGIWTQLLVITDPLITMKTSSRLKNTTCLISKTLQNACPDFSVYHYTRLIRLRMADLPAAQKIRYLPSIWLRYWQTA